MFYACFYVLIKVKKTCFYVFFICKLMFLTSMDDGDVDVCVVDVQQGVDAAVESNAHQSAVTSTPPHQTSRGPVYHSGAMDVDAINAFLADLYAITPDPDDSTASTSEATDGSQPDTRKR